MELTERERMSESHMRGCLMVLERVAGEGRRELATAIKIALDRRMQARRQAMKLTARGTGGE